MGCGRIRPKHELVRHVLDGGRVVPDPEARRPGRGAYLCPEPGCRDRALARRAFERALLRHRPARGEQLHSDD